MKRAYCVICRTPTKAAKLCVDHRRMSPAEQLRVHLERDRERGVAFEVAYSSVLDEDAGRIAWPHNTTHRREWKAILDSPRQREVWRAAFENEPVRSLANLELAA